MYSNISKQILIAEEEATCSNIGRQKTHIEKRGGREN